MKSSVGNIFLAGCVVGLVGAGIYCLTSPDSKAAAGRMSRKITRKVKRGINGATSMILFDMGRRKLNCVKRNAANNAIRFADDAGERISDWGRYLAHKIR